MDTSHVLPAGGHIGSIGMGAAGVSGSAGRLRDGGDLVRPPDNLTPQPDQMTPLVLYPLGPAKWYRSMVDAKVKR